MSAEFADNLHPHPVDKVNAARPGDSAAHAADGLARSGREEPARRGGFFVRVCDVFGTPWRIPRSLRLKKLGEFTLTRTFKNFYINQQGLPKLLEQEYHAGGSQLTIDGSSDDFADLVSVEVVLFALPIPVNQVVGAVVVDLWEPAISSAPDSRIKKFFDAMVSDEIRLRVAGRSVAEIVDELAERAGAERVDQPAVARAGDGAAEAAGVSRRGRNGRAAKRRAAKQMITTELTAVDQAVSQLTALEKARVRTAGRPDADESQDDDEGYALRLDEERHLLVFAYPADPSEPRPPHLDREARALIHGVHWPHQPEFATIKRPDDLNADLDPGPREADDKRYAALSHYASVLYGQSGEVNASALLIAAQTVGTAARFQLIWSRAFQQVEDFQLYRQSQGVGQQTRESLAPLADEMGNLELDLTFNVQTAADLGLGSTTAFVDSFQSALHDVMKFRKRAETVAEMVQRVNSSIQSELTAIISREREAEERRRRAEEKRRSKGAAIIGALSFVLAPLTVVFGFFGVNTADVGKDDHIYDFRQFWLVYVVAVVLTGVAITWAFVMVRSPKIPPVAPSDVTQTPLVTRGRRRRGKQSRTDESAIR